MLPRKIIKIYNDIAQKHGNVTVKDFQKYEKLKYKHNKLKLEIDFPNYWEQLGEYLKFLIISMELTYVLRNYYDLYKYH